MKKIYLIITVAALTACSANNSKTHNEENRSGNSFTVSLDSSREIGRDMDHASFNGNSLASSSDEYYNDDEEDDDDYGYEEDYASDMNYYHVSSSPRSITVHDMNGNYAHYSVDDFGNVSGYDNNGNYYHSHTDDFGNTSGYDNNGNYYHSRTDDFGNTSGYDSNGNYYNLHTDDFGNTTGYDSNGNYYSAHTDDFGNTTITTY